MALLLAARVSSAEAGFLCANDSAEPIFQIGLETPPLPAEDSKSTEVPLPEETPEVDLPTADLAETTAAGVPSSQVINNSASSPGAAHSERCLLESEPELSQELVTQANSALPPPLANRLFRPPRNV